MFTTATASSKVIVDAFADAIKIDEKSIVVIILMALPGSTIPSSATNAVSIK